MKICVVTPLYAIAGVPLAQLRFARALADRGHVVDLLIGRVDSQYQLPVTEGVNTMVLNKRNVREMLLPLWEYLRDAKPDVVFSAEDHLNAMVLLSAITSRSKARISCSSRVTPFDTYSSVPFTKKWFLKQFVRAVSWRADALTCVSKGTVEEYRQVFKFSPHVCVYNIVDDKFSRKKMQEPIVHEWLGDSRYSLLVAAGRLAHWKDYKTLIRGVKILSQKRKVRLLILGDGPQKSELRSLIKEFELEKLVKLEGYVDNPLKYFRKADLFVHSAIVESLGNVLVEAMMCGCTPVSTDCPTGPREVLKDGKYGYLVAMRDPEAMASAIDYALDNAISKDLLFEAVKRFEENSIINQHFNHLGLSGFVQ